MTDSKMTGKYHPDQGESLSAIVDGEATDWEVRKILQQSAQDDHYRQQWQSYQLIGAALRRESYTGKDISAAVRDAVKGQRRGSHGWLTTARKSITQTAVAASVAAVVVLGVQQYQIAGIDTAEQGGSEIASSQINSTAPTVPLQLPEGFAIPEIATQTVSRTSSPTLSPVQVLRVQVPVFDRNELVSHFEESLIQHSENATQASQIVIPRARLPLSSEEE